MADADQRKCTVELTEEDANRRQYICSHCERMFRKSNLLDPQSQMELGYLPHSINQMENSYSSYEWLHYLSLQWLADSYSFDDSPAEFSIIYLPILCLSTLYLSTLYSSTLYSSTLYLSTLYSSTLYLSTLYLSTLHSSTLYSSTLYLSTLYLSTLYSSTLYSSILSLSILSSSILYSSILSSSILRWPADSSTSTPRQHQREPEIAQQLSPSFSTISRVCKVLRDLQRETYDPKEVGLGIYQHEMSPYSSEMGKQKLKALCTTAKRQKGIAVDNLVAEIQALDLEIRNCYRDSKGNLSEEILAWNFAMDASFILEFLRSLYWFSDHNIEREIMTDIFKLENQIPLFILLRILELEFRTPEKAISKFADMLCMHPQFAILPFSLKPMELEILHAEIEANIREKPFHLLHLLSKTIEAFLRPSNPTGDTGVHIVNDWIDFISAVVNRDVNIEQKFLIRFKLSKDGKVQFKKGWFGSSVLCLPQIYLFEETEPLLWNLIAFAIGSENIIGHFIVFLKCIIYLNNKNDKNVALLRKAQIIISKMSNEKLDTMFCKLSNVICGRCGPFENVWGQIREHSENPFNRSMLRFTCLLVRFALIGFTLLFCFVVFKFVIR